MSLEEARSDAFRGDHRVFDPLAGAVLERLLEENDATRIERQVRKAAAALLLEGRIGQRFEQGWEGLDVGDRVQVKRISTDVERGFIDFARVGR